MPKGGGGGGRSGGGGYRSGGSYRGGGGYRTRNGGASSYKIPSDQKNETKGEGSSVMYTGGGGSHGPFTRATPQATPSQLEFAPSHNECESKFQNLRSCLEANDDRLGSCHWYFTAWKNCQQERGVSSGYSAKTTPAANPKAKTTKS